MLDTDFHPLLVVAYFTLVFVLSASLVEISNYAALGTAVAQWIGLLAFLTAVYVAAPFLDLLLIKLQRGR